jgi:hypothetical protein
MTAFACAGWSCRHSCSKTSTQKATLTLLATLRYCYSVPWQNFFRLRCLRRASPTSRRWSFTHSYFRRSCRTTTHTSAKFATTNSSVGCPPHCAICRDQSSLCLSTPGDIIHTPERSCTRTGVIHNKYLRTPFFEFSRPDKMSTHPRWHQGMMYNNPIRSDVVIKFGDRTIHAHKSILMAGSGLFYTAFNSNFAIAQASVDEIEGHEPDIVEDLIRAIYDDIIFIKNTTPTRSPQEFALPHFMIANEYEVPRLGRAAAEYLVWLCGHHVRRSTTDGNHLTDLRLLLEEIAALYQDNAIADRSLINGVANFLRIKPHHKLIISIPEVLEVLYVQRTTDRSQGPLFTLTSTLFPPVTMANWSRPDSQGGLDVSVFSRKPKEPRVPPPRRPVRSKTSRRR